MENEIIKIVLTGGPCGGKSTALSKLVEWLLGYGFPVAVVPESATELITSHITPTSYDDDIQFQFVNLENVLSKEEIFSKALNMLPGRRNQKVLICDRGTMDGEAYCTPESYLTVLDNFGLSKTTAQARYKMVIHLVTAADGALEFYTTSNNKARKESPEEAMALDRKTMEAWSGSERLHIIDNSTNFEKKLLRVCKALATVLNLPAPTQIQKKFDLGPDFKLSEIPVPLVKSEIQQIYLAEKGEFVRSNEQNGKKIFQHKLKTPSVGLQRNEVESLITKEMFNDLKKRRDDGSKVIRKTRHYFIWGNQYFWIDQFHDSGLYLLECVLTEEQQEVKLPPFLKNAKDVTDNPEFYNSNIARQ